MSTMTTTGRADPQAARDLRFRILAAVRPFGFECSSHDPQRPRGVKLSWRRLRELMPQHSLRNVGRAGVEACAAMLAGLVSDGQVFDQVDRPRKHFFSIDHAFVCDGQDGFWAFKLESTDFDAFEEILTSGDDDREDFDDFEICLFDCAERLGTRGRG